MEFVGTSVPLLLLYVKCAYNLVSFQLFFHTYRARGTSPKREQPECMIIRFYSTKAYLLDIEMPID